MRPSRWISRRCRSISATSPRRCAKARSPSSPTPTMIDDGSDYAAADQGIGPAGGCRHALNQAVAENERALRAAIRSTDRLVKAVDAGDERSARWPRQSLHGAGHDWRPQALAQPQSSRSGTVGTCRNGCLRRPQQLANRPSAPPRRRSMRSPTMCRTRTPRAIRRNPHR